MNHTLSLAQIISPALVLGILLSAGYASLYHLWGGRSLRDLGLYFIVAAGGFAVGQAVGVLVSAELLRIGQLRVLEASIGAWLALLSVRLFSGPLRSIR